ncbi:hypothetical protein [Mycoplasma zalophi]|uniref:hypothetical protein n=1 Tax=Mycoplasma zalophi TaxID=191287 RepID=UPI003590202F
MFGEKGSGKSTLLRIIAEIIARKFIFKSNDDYFVISEYKLKFKKSFSRCKKHIRSK